MNNNSNQNSTLSSKEDQAAIQWTLSETDIEIIFSNCNGEQQCLCFALQLCALRNTGQFLQNPQEHHGLSKEGINYLATQLELNIPVSFSYEINKNTESKYQEKIRDYLNYSTFDEPAQQKLQEWTAKTLNEKILSHKDLFQEAINFLKEEKIIGPSKIQLGRFLSSEKQKIMSFIYSQITKQLTEKTKKFYDSDNSA